MYWYTPAFLQAQHGVVLYRLGRHAEAVELLTSGLADMPAQLRNAEWAGEYREALEAARVAD
ncbi:hypothetical protein GTS_47920 [Gandjariella thermophila]|uniref:Tetratricopeptide repeat protein n=1 Tax=Gandjariella thermophila TaxID=1931992 RepID=A0A4D4JFQ7_9PSEU|nr:hypothetical protein GTS_47920 [Gandjariella thermophila]